MRFLLRLLVGVGSLVFLFGNGMVFPADGAREQLAIPSPTPTPDVQPLREPMPTDRAILEYLWRLHKIEQDLDQLESKINTTLDRMQQDVTGDGQPEIIVRGVHHTETVFLAVLAFNAQAGWHEIGYIEDYGHYCLDTRTTIQSPRIIFDVYGCSGGTGVRNGTWTQHWLECKGDACAEVWQGELLFFERIYNWDWRVSFRISHIEQSSPTRVTLTTERFGFDQIPTVGIGDNLPSNPRRIAGPTTREMYQWNGKEFALVSEQELSGGIEISREFHWDEEKTTDYLSHQLTNLNRDNFWGIEDTEKQIWTKKDSYLGVDRARLNSDKSILAAVLGSQGNNRCRLIVGRLDEKQFKLIGRLDLSCVPNFTNLEWQDIDRDGREELLMLTLANEGADEPGMERLRIFQVSTQLEQIANIVGDVNGRDGVGIRWENDVNGFRVYTGVTSHFTGNPSNHDCVTLSCVSNERRWKAYRWDSKTHQLIEETTPKWQCSNSCIISAALELTLTRCNLSPPIP